MKKGRIWQDFLTWHHIVPESRCNEFGIVNPDEDDNLKQVLWSVHEAWNSVFFNSVPDEVIARLLAIDMNLWRSFLGDERILSSMSTVIELCSTTGQGQWARCFSVKSALRALSVSKSLIYIFGDTSIREMIGIVRSEWSGPAEKYLNLKSLRFA